MLDGSVQRLGSTVRITGQLIRATMDQHVGGGPFDKERTTASLCSLQSELAQTIATVLRPALSPAAKKLLERRPTENLAVCELFLKARAMDVAFDDPASKRLRLRKQETWLPRAVELDPRFTAAWAELAGNQGRLIQTKTDTLPDRDAKAKAAVDRATSLEPDWPDVMGRLAFYDGYGGGDRTRRAEAWKRLLRVAPDEAGAYGGTGQTQLSEGREADAPHNPRQQRPHPTSPARWPDRVIA